MIGTLVVIAICAAITAVGYFVPSALNAVFDLLDLLIGWTTPFVAVTLISAVTGVLFILAFPHVSSQRAIVAVKDKIKHNLLGIRIFQDDMRTVGKGVVGSLLWNFGYLALNLLPMAVLAAPFMVIWFQLNALYAYQPLDVGEKTTIVAEFDPQVKAHEVAVTAPEGVRVLRRGNTTDKVVLEVETTAEGAHDIAFAHGGQTITKTVEVGTHPRRLARLRTSEPFSKFVAAKDPIVMFGDPVLAAGSFVRTIEVPYDVRPLGFLSGGEISIMIWFVIVSLAVGFGLKGVFGVEI